MCELAIHRAPQVMCKFSLEASEKVADAVSRFAIDEPKNKTIPKLFIFPSLFSLETLKISM